MPEPTDFDWESTFDQLHRVTVGNRGDPTVVNNRTETDLDGLSEITEETIPTCACGIELRRTDHTATDGGTPNETDNESRIHRCVTCNDLACDDCALRLGNRSYCPWCIEQQYQLDKRVYLGLYYIDTGVATINEFATVDTVNDDPVEIAIDHAATVMTDHGYVDTETGKVTRHGQTALSMGNRLYSDDPDVQAIHHEIRIREITTRRR